MAAAVALGSLITPFVIGDLGVRGAMAVLGLPSIALAALTWRRLHGVDCSIVHRDREIALLRGVAILSPLPMSTIDGLAAVLETTTVAAGHEVFRQGDPGEHFYVIEDGEADVVGDGRVVNTLRSGDCFGEIALLREIPRTATIRARTSLRLCSLARPEFLLAVTGFSASAREADLLSRDRLASFAPHGPAD